MTISELGIAFDDAITFEQWMEVGDKLGRVTRTSLFWIGDWLNYGQDRWNGGKRFEKMPDEQRERHERAMKLTGLELATLHGASHVARRIPLSLRSSQLSFEHHRLIARVRDEQQRQDWIAKSEATGLSTRRLRKSLNANRIVSTDEMRPSNYEPRETHLLCIQRLIQWWAKVKDQPDNLDMGREELETVLRDFEPVLEIIATIRARAEHAVSYLEDEEDEI